MLRAVPEYIKDVSVLRRLLFAVAHLPDDLPNRWELAADFAFKSHTNRGSPLPSVASAKLFIENIQELDSAAFLTDKELLLELMDVQDSKSRPLGIILISKHDNCANCGSKLQVRKDRPAKVTVYDDVMGSVPGTHFHKTCSNRACGMTQFYGYTTYGKSPEVHFDADWESLPFFISSRESVFSMQQLRRFDSEIVIGHMSFKQCAESYNYLHCYTKASNEVDGPSQ
jgi:hypothetical protein